MNQYIKVKGIYDKGKVQLLEVPDQNLISHAEVTVLIPLRKSRKLKKDIGIPINDFVKKINLFTIGGDAIQETEGLYDD